MICSSIPVITRYPQTPTPPIYSIITAKALLRINSVFPYLCEALTIIPLLCGTGPGRRNSLYILIRPW